MEKKKKIANRGGGRYFIVGSLCRKRQSGVAVCPSRLHWQCSANFSRGAISLRPVRRKFTHVSHNRCIFVHMVGRDTSHSCVIMKFIYHYTWSRQIIFNSQKLVKRRWTGGCERAQHFIIFFSSLHALFFHIIQAKLNIQQKIHYLLFLICTSSIYYHFYYLFVCYYCC